MVNVGPLNPGNPSMNIDQRPRPVRDAAVQLKNWIGVLSTVVAALGASGALMSADQVTAVQGVLTAFLVLVPAVSTVLTAFGIVRRSEPLVTPMQDPRDNDGSRLMVVDRHPGAGGMVR